MREQFQDLGRTLLATLKAFRDERGTTAAGALAYSTFLSLIPAAFLMVILVDPLASALHVESASGEGVLTRILDWLAPSSRDAVLSWLQQAQQGLATNKTSLGLLGFGVFIVTSALLFIAVEDALNDVWKSPRRRRLGTRIAYFWCVATLVPVMGLLSISAVSGTPLVGGAMESATFATLCQWAMSVGLVGGMYLVFPVTHVSWRAAFWGGIVAGSLFELSKWGFSSYVAWAKYYESVFAGSASIPIFILWTYLAWAIVLLGAHLARIIDGGLPRPAAPPPPERLAVAVAMEAARVFLAGRGPVATADIAARLAVPHEAVELAARRLCAGGVLAEVANENETTHVLPARSPADTPAIDVVVAARDAGGDGAGGAALQSALARMDAAARQATGDLTWAQLAGGGPAPQRQQARGRGSDATAAGPDVRQSRSRPVSGGGERSGPPPAAVDGAPAAAEPGA